MSLDSRNPFSPFAESLSQWSKRPWLSDVAIVVLFELIMAVNVVAGDVPVWAMFAYQTLFLPLLVRRRYPFLVLAVVCVISTVFMLFGGRVDGLPVVMVAVYAVAVSRDRNGALLALAAAEVFVLSSVFFGDSTDSRFGSFVFQSGLVLASLFLGTTVRSRRLHLQALEERAIRLERERDQQAEMAAARERTRIAREMHDIVAHSLSVIITLADGAAATAQRDPKLAGETMEQVAATGRQALGEMRNLLGVLRSDESASLAPQPDMGHIERLLDEVRATGLPVSVTITGAPRSLSSTQETTIYRFVQEGLTNVLKHARYPSHAWVTLEWEPNLVRLEVRDDGMAALDAARHDGLGLRGMKERFTLFGGEMSAGPLQPRGWATRGLLPLEQESA